MDSVSQFVLGASVGEAILGKKLGNRAILWGGIAGTIPDLDVLTRPFLDIVDEVAFHRSISHSVLLFVVLAPVFGWLLSRVSKRKEIGFWLWTHLFFWCFFTHALLDCFTTWGTQLFWPFESRIAWKTIFVVDPVYTIPFLVVLGVILFMKSNLIRRRRLNYFVLIFSSCYLLFTVLNKRWVDAKFNEMAEADNISVLNLDSRPAPFQNVLWTANIETKDDFRIYYFSWFDDYYQEGYTVNKNHELLIPYLHDEDVQKLIKISEGFYALQKSDSGIVFNDLRFGQAMGWEDQKSPFVFAYRISLNNDKVEISEIPKDIKDVKRLFPSLFTRIKGIFKS